MENVSFNHGPDVTPEQKIEQLEQLRTAVVKFIDDNSDTMTPVFHATGKDGLTIHLSGEGLKLLIKGE